MQPDNIYSKAPGVTRAQCPTLARSHTLSPWKPGHGCWGRGSRGEHSSSFSHRPLLGPNVQASRKAEPTCPESTPLPRPCSCRSCRSTGLRGAGSGSQTLPPRSSGGPRRCHEAGCGRGRVRASAEETPGPSTTPSRAPQSLGQPSCVSLTPTNNKRDEGRERKGSESRGDPGRHLQTEEKVTTKIKKEKRKPTEDVENPVGS